MTIRADNEIVDSINPATDQPWMRPLDASEAHGFQGIEGRLEDARIAELEIDGIGAQLVLCQNALQLHLWGPEDELICYDYPEERRPVRELMAQGLLNLADLGLDFEDLERLGWERIV